MFCFVSVCFTFRRLFNSSSETVSWRQCAAPATHVLSLWPRSEAGQSLAVGCICPVVLLNVHVKSTVDCYSRCCCRMELCYQFNIIPEYSGCFVWPRVTSHGVLQAVSCDPQQASFLLCHRSPSYMLSRAPMLHVGRLPPVFYSCCRW